MTPISVLLVDDEAALLRAVSRLLRGPDLEVLTASNAEEALTLLRRRPIDVIVSDIDMPGTSGLELLAQVRDEFPSTIRMLLTGAATTDRALSAINEGEVARFFVKPFDGKLFRATLVALRDRIDRTRHDEKQRSQKARVDALRAWAENTFPGTSRVRRMDDGTIVVDPRAAELFRA